MAKQTLKRIEEALLDQLDLNGRLNSYNQDLVNDYMEFVRLKNELQKDIKQKGIRIEEMNGNGFLIKKPNESIQNLVKVNAQMLKILTDLDLKLPNNDSIPEL